MLQQKFKDSKFLVVVFPGGTGGNHIQNMISLSPVFNQLFDSNTYYNDLLKKYQNIKNKIVGDVQGITAHFNKYPNLQALQDINYRNLISNSERKTIIIGHDHCFLDALQNNYFVDFEQCVWLIVTWPQTEDSLVYKRIMKNNYWPQLTYKYTFPYLVPTSKHYYIDSFRGFHIDPIKLFSINGSQYLRKLLSENFNLELPIEADELHKIWFEMQLKF